MILLLAMMACKQPSDSPQCGEETCNGVDDDCDGQVDEAGGQWFADGDGDGFGVEAVDGACDAPPAGATEQSGDCDDGDAAIHPDAQELCDEADVDEDCDGLSDDADDDAVGKLEVSVDRDGDGYGSEGEEELRCDPDPDQLTALGDCDDADPERHPGASEEGVGLLEDFACDGSGGLTSQADCVLVGEYGSRTSGSSGQVLSVGDMDGDGIDELLWASWRVGIGPGAVAKVYLFTGSQLQGCETLLAEQAQASLEVSVANDSSRLVAVGDTSGDGVPEIGVYTPYALQLYDGAALLDAGTLTEPTWAVGLDRPDGDAVGLGDLDADGHAELLLIVDNALGVLPGSALGSEQVVDVTGQWWPISTELDVSDLVFSGTGDFDGDGLTDAGLLWFEGRQDARQLVLPGADIGPTGAELKKSNAVLHYDQDTNPYSLFAGFLGDLDADGRDDLWMGARPLSEGELRTFLTTELSLGRPLAWDDHETALTSEVTDDLLGDCMVDVGDMDADGKDDFLACSPGFPLENYSYGAGFLFLSEASPSGELDVSEAQAPIYTDSAWKEEGFTGASAGDFDGDGRPDLAFSSDNPADDDFSAATAYIAFNRL